CPTAAISLRAGKITGRANETRPAARPTQVKRNRTLAWSAAIVVLVAALVHFNWPAQSVELSPAEEPAVTATAGNPEEVSAVPDLPVGPEVGMLGPDFSIPLYGGGTFDLADTRGTVTVINFWATWCTPCVAELPHFDKLYRTYGDSIEVVAVHSDLITDDVDAYLADYDYTIHFAQDDSGVVPAYGGSAMLPQTIILDKDGVIIYNAVGSVTYEFLESLVTPLIAD
ncbi:MAG: TlpA family protein disulfide reductase, partial [Oscillospiraceae bacterium]|nr:TlpA family protein disulfide reductase [Oscillospiraceae bacterium]